MDKIDSYSDMDKGLRGDYRKRVDMAEAALRLVEHIIVVGE